MESIYSRKIVFAILIILIIEFIVGMWLNLFAAFPQFNFSSMMNFMASGSMGMLMLHIALGVILGILGIALLMFIPERGRLFSIIGLISIIIAGINGLFFMYTGFSNNYYSFFMALFWVISIVSYSMVIQFTK
ncbi:MULTISPECIES: hypothetical protein [Acidianus]|uniref:Uncharacterized protein n=1 Tax=Candidatus Acidianus copahuensis TaxID=1160895 RepID=A0A031LK56_9CREN|nr:MULTISPECIES: hypothetical protein [Acidianus]EZQ01619.1 hypothetical protein CM19_12830 [Candidatus Acidianus copahuensis]NON63404.1 hypothetical protein [Acidianus sp. RZ1]